jgi:hypothetical protein
MMILRIPIANDINHVGFDEAKRTAAPRGLYLWNGLGMTLSLIDRTILSCFVPFTNYSHPCIGKDTYIGGSTEESKWHTSKDVVSRGCETEIVQRGVVRKVKVELRAVVRTCFSRSLWLLHAPLTFARMTERAVLSILKT